MMHTSVLCVCKLRGCKPYVYVLDFIIRQSGRIFLFPFLGGLGGGGGLVVEVAAGILAE